MEEAPECPVCLQSYDNDTTIPRVLACGHSSCDDCLNKLPKKFPDTIRCPACTVLVKFPPQGPSALPKNIDLLRLFPSISSIKSESSRNPKQSVEFVTRSWPDEFHATWKDKILQHDAVSLQAEGNSLLSVASLEGDDSESVLEYSYIHRMMSSLWEMSDDVRYELDVIISVKQRGVSKVFGLWGDLKNGIMYLVGEKLTSFSLDEESVDLSNTTWLDIFGMQICEAVLGLHKEGLVIGCLSVSFLKLDEFENACIDLIELVETGRNVYRIIGEETSSGGGKEMGMILFRLLQKGIFVSSDLLFELLNERRRYLVSYSSDVWPICYFFYKHLLGKSFLETMMEGPKEDDLLVLYTCITEKLTSRIGIHGMKETFLQCCCLDPQERPALTDLWKCMRELVIRPMIGTKKVISSKRKQYCLMLGELCHIPYDSDEEEESTVDDDMDFVKRLSQGKIKSKDMRGHQDSVTGLAIGGGFLFSSSFDKNILVWSLKDFSHVHTFKGHKDKVTSLIHVEGVESVCISADNEGGIFVWSTTFPLQEHELRKWYEPKDWRYTGIHALTYAEYGHVYSGSGDNTVKAWSLQDGSLVCTMTGHRSVVSTLVVLNGVLYSGSWDGTVRLWSLNNHSLLAVFGDETPGIVRSVLSLAGDDQTLVAAYQNGDIQIWRDDTLMKSIQIQSGTILSVVVSGKWIFTGGWDKTVNVQEFSGDEISIDCTHVGSIPCSSVITSLLYWEGKLFAGFADATVKVYYCGKPTKAKVFASSS